jgi:hypothetical protein
MRTKRYALPAQGLPNAIQPAVLRIFINGFASQKEQNNFNCFTITLSFSVKIQFQRLKSKLLYDWVSQSVSQSVCLGIEYPCGTCDQILLPVGMLLSEICGLVSVGSPLWWEHGSAICSVFTQWSESLRTRNHILLSHLRLPQPVPVFIFPRNRLAQLYTGLKDSIISGRNTALCYKPEGRGYETRWRE